MIAAFVFMMPQIYLSGFVFPIQNMPAPVRALTYAVPLRYYAEVIRGVFLRGSGLDTLWVQGAVLTGFGIASLGLATLRFRKSLD